VLRQRNAGDQRGSLIAARRNSIGLQPTDLIRGAVPSDRHAPAEIGLPHIPGGGGADCGAGPTPAVERNAIEPFPNTGLAARAAAASMSSSTCSPPPGGGVTAGRLSVWPIRRQQRFNQRPQFIGYERPGHTSEQPARTAGSGSVRYGNRVAGNLVV
jgi:hypothetical protein